MRCTLRDDLQLTGWLIGALDALDRTLASDDPATQTEQRIDQRWLRAQLTLRRSRPDGGEAATLWFGRDRSHDDLLVGTIGASQHIAQWVGGARASQRSRLSDIAMLTVGVDVDGERAQ